MEYNYDNLHPLEKESQKTMESMHGYEPTRMKNIATYNPLWQEELIEEDCRGGS